MIINSLVKIEYDHNILLSRQDVQFITYIKHIKWDYRNINIPQRHWSSGQEVIYKEKMHPIKLFSLSYTEFGPHFFSGCTFINFYIFSIRPLLMRYYDILYVFLHPFWRRSSTTFWTCSLCYGELGGQPCSLRVNNEIMKPTWTLLLYTGSDAPIIFP